MIHDQQTEVTERLRALRAGDPQAEDRLYPIVYDELRRAAARMLGGAQSIRSGARGVVTLRPWQ